jgi:serine/threonine-protein kinase RsbW
MSNSPEITICIPSEADYVSAVRLAVAAVATRLKFPLEDIEDIKIAVSEACTNVVQHAYENGEGKIDIKCIVLPKELKIEVRDSGKGFDKGILGTSEQIQQSEEKLGLGLGLTFIKNLMDTMKLDTELGKGTTLTMSKKIPSGE